MDSRDQGEAAAQDTACPMALLPGDVLADVLRRLLPHGLAACRCVCKAWLAIVDSRRLLRADLLPISLGGFFINFNRYDISEFFAPLSGACISGKRSYLPDEALSASWGSVDDHCNGLVLIHDYYSDEDNVIIYVLNPATRCLVRLPLCPPPPIEIKYSYQFEYLAYDPTESPYFEVVSATRFRWVLKPGDFNYDSSKDALNPEIEQSEWPPSLYILNVFSSRTQKWEERSFSREGDPIGTVSDMRWDWLGHQRNAVYWQGTLYIHCKTECVMRLSLLSAKYHVIKPPPGIEVTEHPQFYLGKSSKGVYCASIKGSCRVQVRNLNELGCQMEWELIDDRDLSKWLMKHKLDYTRPCASYGLKLQRPWALQDINNYYYDYRNRHHDIEASEEEKIEWTSQGSEDEKFIWSSDDECVECGDYGEYLEILGFHPYKEIIFLSETITRGLAYHLNSSKVEILGNIFPTGYEKVSQNEQFFTSSFSYTPCWITQTANHVD